MILPARAVISVLHRTVMVIQSLLPIRVHIKLYMPEDITAVLIRTLIISSVMLLFQTWQLLMAGEAHPVTVVFLGKATIILPLITVR